MYVFIKEQNDTKLHIYCVNPKQLGKRDIKKISKNEFSCNCMSQNPKVFNKVAGAAVNLITVLICIYVKKNT
jgi:hypothetical protein